jgi:hypothetical protein
MSDEQSVERDREEEDLPGTAAKSGLPQGGNSGAGGKAPPGSPATEDVRGSVAGGPADETTGAIEPDDKYGSQQGAAAAMDPNQPPATPSGVYVDPDADPPAGTHVGRQGKGEEQALDEKEPGREQTGETETGRPIGTRSARDATGVSPEKRGPQDPDSPEAPPG